MDTKKIHSGKIERRGLMFVLSSPSGAGKTTLSRMLIRDVAGLRLSVSATTRPMRPGEVDGKDYHFVDATRFQTMINGGELLEWAKVFDNHYGTPRAPVDAALSAGEDVLFDIDWQGTQQLRDKAAQDVVSVFILPPSVPDLEQRLRSRAQDSDDVIRNRMHKAGDEMSHWDAYDYIVINRNVDEAFDAVRAILFAERLKRERQIGLASFVRGLRQQL
jgi:guanylate kinase